MTNPYGGSDNGTPDDDKNPESNGLPQYGATNHPEDREDFGQKNTGGYGGYAGYGGYGSAPDDYSAPADNGAAGYAGASASAYGAGAQAYGDGGYTVGAESLTMPNPQDKVDFMAAIKWGFSAAVRNWKLWVLGTLLFFFVCGLLSGVSAAMSPSPEAAAAGATSAGASVMNLLSSVISLIVTPIILRLAVRQIDDPATGWGHVGKDVKFVPVIVVNIVVGILMTILFALIAIGLFFFVTGNPNEFFNAVEGMSETEFIDAYLGKILIDALILFIVAIVLSVFTTLMPWLASEGRYGIGASIKQGFALGKKNFGQLLGYQIVMGLLTIVVGILTLGIAMLFIVPAGQLASAHIYRQAIGGPIPVPRRKV